MNLQDFPTASQAAKTADDFKTVNQLKYIDLAYRFILERINAGSRICIINRENVFTSEEFFPSLEQIDEFRKELLRKGYTIVVRATTHVAIHQVESITVTW